MNETNETTKAIYHFIRTFILKKHRPPSIREIASGCYVSVGTVIRHLDRLELTGRMTREPNQARGITLLAEN